MFIPRCLFAIILLICTASKFLFAEHANHTWEKSYKSVVNVLPTWPGYERPGFCAATDIAPAGTGFYFELKPSPGQGTSAPGTPSEYLS